MLPGRRPFEGLFSSRCGWGSNSGSNNAGRAAPAVRRSGATAAAALPLLWRSAAASLVIAMAAPAEPAHAAAGKGKGKKRGGAYPPRVQQILDHLAAHPMRVTSQFMQYDAAPTTALPACAAGLSPDDCLAPPAAAEADSDARRHYARVIAALLLAAVGGLDQAHNLVTPLCWGAPTPYAGAPVRGSPAAREAAYVHAVVHRQEGACDGEFGSGWSNANYWYAAAGAGDHPIARPLADAARALAAGDAALERAAAGICGGGKGGGGGSSGSGGSSKGAVAFNAPNFVATCARAAEARGDGKLSRFCGGVMAAELALLLDHCYAAAAAAGAAAAGGGGGAKS